MGPQTYSHTSYVSPVDQHIHSLGPLARRLVGDYHATEDLLQELRIRVLQHPPKRQRPSEVAAYLKATLRQLAADHHRREALRRSPSLDSVVEVASPEPTPLDVILLTERQRQVLRELGLLEDRFPAIAQALRLRFLEGRSYADFPATARAATWRSHVNRGIRRLRSALGLEC